MAESEGQSCDISIKLEKTLCFLNGTLIPPFIAKERVLEIQTLKIRASDIIICSFPKSGTNWLAYILRLLSYKEKMTTSIEHKLYFLEVPFHKKTTEETQPPNKLFDLLTTSKEEFENRKPPRIMFTHLQWPLVPKHPDAKYFYMYRNPKDIVLSGYHHFTNMPAVIPAFPGTFGDFFDYFIETELFGFIQHLECYFKHKSNPNFMFISYEELQANFKVKVYEIAAFIGVEMTEELYKLVVQETEFKTMQQNDVVNLKFTMKEGENFLWKGVAGQWKEALTPEQIKAVDDMLREKLDEEFLKKLNFM